MRCAAYRWTGLALLSGCLYLSPVNERPSVTEIRAPSEIRRNARVMLTAEYHDPDGKPVGYAWRTYACAGKDEAGRAIDCDTQPSFQGMQAAAEVSVPVKTAGGQLVQALLVRLEVRDDRGAVSSPAQRVLDVQNANPTLAVRGAPRRRLTVGAPIELFARFGDADDGAEAVEPLWRVFSPTTQPPYTLEERTVPVDEDPAFRAMGKTLVPQGAGEWKVEVSVRDPLGAIVQAQLSFTIVPDQPPCLARMHPIIAPGGAAVPITEPTVLEVALIDDDLDPYPAVSGDPAFGGATFVWSILRPGAPRWQVLAGATGNAIDFDPAAYSPGELVELRVETFDRKQIGLPCPDNVRVCSVISNPSCVQRQTWRVEAR